MAKIKVDAAIKELVSNLAVTAIDQIKDEAIDQLLTTGKGKLEEYVAETVKTYTASLLAYAENTESWWVKVRNKFLAKIIDNSVDAIVEAVVASLHQVADKGTTKLKEKVK